MHSTGRRTLKPDQGPRQTRVTNLKLPFCLFLLLLLFSGCWTPVFGCWCFYYLKVHGREYKNSPWTSGGRVYGYFTRQIMHILLPFPSIRSPLQSTSGWFRFAWRGGRINQKSLVIEITINNNIIYILRLNRADDEDLMRSLSTPLTLSHSATHQCCNLTLTCWWNDKFGMRHFTGCVVIKKGKQICDRNHT